MYILAAGREPDTIISSGGNGIMMAFKTQMERRHTLASAMGRPNEPRGLVSPFGLAAWQRIALGLFVLSILWLAIAWAVSL